MLVRRHIDHLYAFERAVRRQVVAVSLESLGRIKVEVVHDPKGDAPVLISMFDPPLRAPIEGADPDLGRREENE